MDTEVRILIVEDVPSDAELIMFELKEAGINFTAKCVKTRAAFTKELEESPPHIILSDYSLPSFDGLSALKIAQERCPDVPFIIVSGALGEERSVELLKRGATDYILKDRLPRLAPAVLRALQEARERDELKHIEAALKESEIKYRTIFENTGAATIIIDDTTLISLANRQFEELSGYARNELEGKRRWTEFIFEDDVAKVKNFKWHRGTNSKKLPEKHEFRIVNRSGDIRHAIAIIAAIPSTNDAVMSLLDITEQKMVEGALKKRELELEMKSRSIEEANTALKVLLKHREEDKSLLEEQVLANVKKLVLPYVEDMKRLNLNKQQMADLEIIEEHLNDIVSPFLRTLSSVYLDLTPREIQIANFVKEGRTTKEITEYLSISATAVDFHRKNLRAKVGIKNSKTNLRSYLASLAPSSPKHAESP